MGSRHEAVTCDACNRSSFELRRYKCLRCFDYDLCGDCYDNQRETKSHLKNHPMQCLLLESDRNIFFANDQSEQKVRSYTCPICGEKGFQEDELATHVFAKHPACNKSPKVEVICPLCVVPADNSNNPRTLFLAQHLTLGHRLKKPAKPTNSSDDSPEAADELSTSIVPNSTRTLRRDLRKQALTSDTGRSWLTAAASNTAWQEEELTHLFSLEYSTLRQLVSNNLSGGGREKIRNAPRSPPHHQNTPSSPLEKCAVVSLAKSESLPKRSESQQIPKSTFPPNNQSQSPLTTVANPTVGVLKTLTPLNVDKKQNNKSTTENSTSKSPSQSAAIDHIQLSDAENHLLAGFVEKSSPTKTDSFGDLVSNHGEGALNLVSFVLNSNSADLSTLPDTSEELAGNKGTAPQPPSPASSSHTLVPPASPSASASKPSKKTCDDRPVCLKDTFGSDWSSFLHELIFDSLRLTGVSEMLTMNDSEPG